MPASRATCAAASSAICGAVIIRTSLRASRGSPGFTDSPSPDSRSRRTASGTAIL